MPYRTYIDYKILLMKHTNTNEIKSSINIVYKNSIQAAELHDDIVEVNKKLKIKLQIIDADTLHL